MKVIVWQNYGCVEVYYMDSWVAGQALKERVRSILEDFNMDLTGLDEARTVTQVVGFVSDNILYQHESFEQFVLVDIEEIK